MEAANQRGFRGVWGCPQAPDLVWKESDYDREEGATRKKQKARPTAHSTPTGPRVAREEGPVLCMGFEKDVDTKGRGKGGERDALNTRLSGEGAAAVAAAAPANSPEGGEKVKLPSPEPPPKLTVTKGGPGGTWTEPVWTQELQGI